MRILLFEKKAVSGILLTLLLVSVFVLAFNIQPVRAQGTIYIRADGSIDPPTAPVQRNGDVYTLTGDISSDADGIVIERDNIVLDGAGFTIQGSGNGISLTGISNVTIRNTNIEDFYAGIWLDSSSNYDIVSGNNITTNTYYGISLHDSCNYNSINGNDITNNEYGIWLYSSSNSSISGNIITNGYFGIWLNSSSNYNNMSGNNIGNNFDKGIALESSSSYNIVNGNNLTNNWTGIHLNSSSNNILIGNDIVNNTIGISLDSSFDDSISGNSFDNNGLFVAEGSFGNSVSDNLVNGKPLVYLEGVSDVVVGDAGEVVLVQCSRIRVEDLNLSSATVGVELWQTNNTELSENSLTANSQGGIYLISSSNNSISGNNITANSAFGISLDSSSNNNVSGNSITANSIGIILSGSSSNKVTHNNFILNGQQAGSEESGYPNVWDDGYPSGGNYWSDYNGADSFSGAFQNEIGSDGIGDSPYVIDANNLDNYPLMDPIPLLAPSQFVASISPFSESILEGQSINFTSTTSGVALPYSYQWCLNDNAVSGATSRSWRFSPHSMGNYSVYLNVTDGLGNSAISNQASVTVGEGPPPLALSISPVSASVYLGQEVVVNNLGYVDQQVSFTANVSGGTPPYKQCDWVVSMGDVVLGGSSGSLENYPELINFSWAISPITSTGTYTVHFDVTDSLGTVAERDAMVTVMARPENLSTVLISPISATMPVVAGQSVEFCSCPTPWSMPPYTYQWYLNDTPVPGATSINWTFIPTQTGDYSVYLNVTNSLGNTTMSNTASVTVTSVLYAQADCPVYLDLYDEQGNCVGYNSTSGTVESQVDNALWESNQTILVFDLSGTYNLKVTGTDDGTYELETSQQGANGTISVVFDLNGTITRGKTQTYLISLRVLPGDINGDGKVSLQDLVLLANAYGSKPGDPNWNPNADLNGDGVVNLADLVILALHYGQHNP